MMKNPDRNTVSRLDALPNVGQAMAEDFYKLGIKHPKELIGRDAIKLFDELCKITNVKHDPCVIDVFMSAIDFMEGGEPKVWWGFTEQRKKLVGG